MQKLTHSEFLGKVSKVNAYYRRGDFSILGEYINSTTKILVENIYGRGNIRPSELLKGANFTIRSAINKKEYFAKRGQSVHGNKYNYSKVVYINNKTKVEIIIKSSGISFFQTPNDHLTGHGSGDERVSRLIQRFRAIYTPERFVKEAAEIHGNLYEYNIDSFVKYSAKVGIFCPIHGEFYQNVSMHLSGQGCPNCGNDRKKSSLEVHRAPIWKDSDWEMAGKMSKEFAGYKCYVLRCWNNEEEFLKIGKTYRKLNRRFSGRMPYEYEVIHVFEGEGIEISVLERTLKYSNKANAYIPLLPFHGRGECFKTLNNINI